jgi:hypothetical protein
MIERNLSLPFELVCATDDANGIDDDIRIADLEKGLIGLGNAYPKLAAFRREAGELFGKRICVIDLDTVIVGKLDQLFERTEPLVIWKDVLALNQPKRFKFNTSLVLMDAGSRSEVWETFSPTKSPQIIRNEGWCGSDQAWVSRTLDEEATWNSSDGVLSWRFEVRGKQMNNNAKIIFFHGKEKPWHMNDSFIKKYWQ